jgi:hypothetical protein
MNSAQGWAGSVHTIRGRAHFCGYSLSVAYAGGLAAEVHPGKIWRFLGLLGLAAGVSQD